VHVILLIIVMLLGLARIVQFYNQSLDEEDRFILNTVENCPRNISCRQQLQNISTWWKFEVLADKHNTEKTDLDVIIIYVSYNDDIDRYIIRNKITVISFKNICTIMNNNNSDSSELKGMIFSEVSKMQRSERASMLRYTYISYRSEC
jgi:hypothetical protein